MIYCQCVPCQITSWNQVPLSAALNPMDLISFAQVVLPSSIVITGSYANLSDFRTPPAVAIPTPEIIAVRIRTTVGTPRLLLDVPAPIGALSVSSLDNANVIEVDFSSIPDPLNINGSTLTVTRLGVSQAATVTVVAPKTARLTLTAPMNAGAPYMFTVFGTPPAIGIQPVTFGGIALDGEPLQIPTGNMVPGGNFFVPINIVPIAMEPKLDGAQVGGWNTPQLTVTSAPVCEAKATDNQQMMNEAIQWNFDHQTQLNNTFAPDIRRILFLRAGHFWKMRIPLNLGTLSYQSIAISLLQNSVASGGKTGAAPVIFFPLGGVAGAVDLMLSLAMKGEYTLGLLLQDSRGLVYMYSLPISCIR